MKSRVAIMISLLGAGALPSCSHNLPRASAEEAPDYVGHATIDEQGVLTLELVSRDRGMIAHGSFTYRPGEPHYDEVLRHVGPIRPGETKPVRPWPDSPSSRD